MPYRHDITSKTVTARSARSVTFQLIVFCFLNDIKSRAYIRISKPYSSSILNNIDMRQTTTNENATTGLYSLHRSLMFDDFLFKEYVIYHIYNQGKE